MILKHMSYNMTILQYQIKTHLTHLSQDKCIQKLYQPVSDQPNLFILLMLLKKL